MGRRSDDNQASVARSNAALRELRGDAEALRAEVRRFRL
jgi:methyl-accepting chemotaxis protein